MSEDNFLARWSRRKIEARTGDAPAAEAAPPAAAAQPVIIDAPLPPPEPLPPLESLTPHSDFSPFMREGVDPTLKGQALKTLFSDPALYPMDGLDVYIDDYSKPDPLPEGWLAKLNQYAALDSHNQPERDAEARKLAAMPASAPPTESAAALPIAQAPPPSRVAPSDTSAMPPDAPDAVNGGPD